MNRNLVENVSHDIYAQKIVKQSLQHALSCAGKLFMC